MPSRNSIPSIIPGRRFLAIEFAPFALRGDHRHHAFRRADDQSFAQRHDGLRIAEEIMAPDRQVGARSAQPFGREEQDGSGGGTAIAFAVNGCEESRQHAGGHRQGTVPRGRGKRGSRFLIPPPGAIPVPGAGRFPGRQAVGLLFQQPATGKTAGVGQRSVATARQGLPPPRAPSAGSRPRHLLQPR